MRYIINNLPRTRSLCLFLSAIFLTGLSGCRKQHYVTDISGIRASVEIKRFEQDLFAIRIDSIATAVPALGEKYRDFFELFNYRIIKIGGMNEPTYPDYLRTFLTDYLNNQVYQETMKRFPDLNVLEDQLSDGFCRYRVHFPDKPVPEVYSFVSRFNQSIVTAEGMLGIGLDNYLGQDHEYYSRLGKQRYQVINMHPGKIPTDCFQGWGMTEFEYNDSVDNVLSNMIYHGKIAYFTKWMLPDQPDSLIMGFTSDQMRFCRDYENTMWEYLVEHRILFESEWLTIQKYTGYGPFTNGFTGESPARASVWLGWRIVEAYARKHPELSLADIMREEDYQKILTLSQYNP